MTVLRPMLLWRIISWWRYDDVWSDYVDVPMSFESILPNNLSIVIISPNYHQLTRKTERSARLTFEWKVWEESTKVRTYGHVQAYSRERRERRPRLRFERKSRMSVDSPHTRLFEGINRWNDWMSGKMKGDMIKLAKRSSFYRGFTSPICPIWIHGTALVSISATA